jgi:hypothetical protein
LGSEQFKEQMLERMEGKLGESHSGELHRETAEQRANRIIAEELARRGWPEYWLRPPNFDTPDFGLWTLDLRLRTATPASWPALPGCGAKRPCPQLE